MISTIIFDCDGVILDSQILIQEALSSTISHFLKNEQINLSLKDVTGLDFDDLNKKLKSKDILISKEMIEHYYTELYRIMSYELTALLKQLILILNKYKIKYCVASNSIRKQINYSLSLVNLKQHIADDRIFTIEQVFRGKPAPDLFLLSAQTMNSNPEECLVIEDSPDGIQAALTANMNVLAFLGGTHAQSQNYQDRIKCYQIPIVKNEQELIVFLKSKYKMNFIN